MSTAEQRLDQAMAHHRQGDLVQAAREYEAALKADPRLADARALLGVVRAQQGAAPAAMALIRSAIAIAPARADFHAHLGGALALSGDTASSSRALLRA